MSGAARLIPYVCAAQCLPLILGEWQGADLHTNARDLAQRFLLRYWQGNGDRARFDLDGYAFIMASRGATTVLLLMRTAPGKGDTEMCFSVLSRILEQLPVDPLPGVGSSGGDVWPVAQHNADVTALIHQVVAEAQPSKLAQANDAVTETTALMKRNVSLVMDRGEKLDSIAQEADRLQDNASLFQRTSQKLKCTLQCNNVKLMLVLIVVAVIAVGVIAYVIAAQVFCGGWDLKGCTG